jgi:hypothetical protein
MASSRARRIGWTLVLGGLLVAVTTFVIGVRAAERTLDGLERVDAGELVAFTPGGSVKALIFTTEAMTCSATEDGRALALDDGWPYLGRDPLGATHGFAIEGGTTYEVACEGGLPGAGFAVAELSWWNGEVGALVPFVALLLAAAGLVVLVVGAFRRRPTGGTPG